MAQRSGRNLLGGCSSSLFVGALLCTVLSVGRAQATPRPLPFTYPYATLPQGALELEQYADLVPVRVLRETDAGNGVVTSDVVPTVRSNLETEIEYGITDHIEAAWYFVFQQEASAEPTMQFDGVKQRVHFRFGETGELPVDLGLYLELAEFHDELEFEEKLILGRRLGPVTLGANLWVEQEYKFQDVAWEYIYNPTAGLTLQVSPSFFLGAEYWVRGTFEGEEEEASDAEGGEDAVHYAGPTLMVQSQRGFASLGVYLRWDHLNELLAPEDPNGRVWVRAIFGLDL